MKRRYTLKFRLILIIGVITILTTVIDSNLSSRFSREQIRIDQNTLLQEVVNNMASRLGQDMHTRAGEIQLLTRMDAIRDPQGALAAKRKIFEEMKRVYPYYAWIGLTDAQGNILTGTDGLLVGKNVAKREWFVEGSKGQHFGDAHDAFLLAKLMPKPQWDDLPLRLVDVSAPVVDDQGRLLGVVCGHLSLDWAFEARQGLLDQMAEQGVDLVVLNQEGRVLLGTPKLPSLQVDLSHLQAWAAMDGQGHGPLVETWPDGKRYLTVAARESTYKSYTGMGWSVVTRKAESLAFAPAEHIGNTLTGIGIVSALLVGIFIWLYIDRQMRPLEAISEAAEAIRRGDIHVAIPKAQSSDEIATFSRSLSELVDSLLHKNEQLRLTNRVFEESAQGILITDGEGNILRVNQAFTDITGYTAEEVYGKTPSLLRSGRHDPGYYREMWRAVAEHGYWSGEIWNRNREGQVYPEWLTISALRNADNTISHYIGLFTDITEKKAYEERLRYLANYDALTGLPNRNLLQEHIQGAIQQSAASGGELSILFIDLDNFKHINDTMGHSAGDLILQEVAGRFLGSSTQGHTLARWGGDEFVLLCPGGNAVEASRVARQMLDTLARPFELEGALYHIGASVGIALYPDDSTSMEGLLRCADTAMYQAKGQGENRFQLYQSAMNSSVERFLRIDNSLRLALRQEGNGLELAYQPQYDINGQQVRGVEVLLRWESEELGSVSPAEFIGVAEESKQINRLGQWVFNRAMEQFRQYLDAGLPPITISINCSPQQLLDEQFAAIVSEAATRNDIPAEQVRLEVTESAIMSDERKVLQVLARLRGMGFTTSIDDFGTGFSCLHYIQRLHPDELKIDKSFIQSAEHDEDSRNIVAFTVGLARSMGLEVVAEGVENRRQLEILREYDNITVQGFFYSKPVPFAQFTALMKQFSAAAGN